MLESSRRVVVSKVLVEGSKGTLSPNDKASKMASRSKREEVQSGDSDSFNSRDVTEGTSEFSLLFEDDERSTSLYISPVPHLSLTGADLLGILDVLNVLVGSEFLKEGDGVFGLFESLETGVGNDEGDLRNLVDFVSSGKNEGREGRSSES